MCLLSSSSKVTSRGRRLDSEANLRGGFYAESDPKETAHSSGSWSHRPVEITAALSMTFCSSRILPGHS